jgi:amino acid transporter
MTLVAQIRSRGGPREIEAFGTPTVVHFCTALLVSALLSAPWGTLSSAALALGASGAGGVVYGLIVVRRARRTTEYRPVMEDWIWHAVFPLVAYGAITASALLLPYHPVPALFTVAAAALLLLFVGIHNSWDTVTYLATDQHDAAQDSPGGDR